MKAPAVVNASPLIVLARIGRVELLTVMWEHVVVPSGVAHEIMRGDRHDPARRWIQDDGNRYVRQVKHIDEVVAGWDLGLGESHVLTYALSHAGSEALLDDAAARVCAQVLGIRLCGTLGVLLRAKRAGLIGAVKPIMQDMIGAGFHLGPDIAAAVLGVAGEQ